MEAHQYAETTRRFHYSYQRNARAVGVLWGIFTVCLAIINIVVFVQPQWIGDGPSSPGIGYFGLYEFCEVFRAGSAPICDGRFDDFSSIRNDAFKAAAFFIGFSALMVLVCICCMLMFFFMKPATVYKVCGWVQIISGACLLVGCLVYPAGWDDEVVQRVCGADASGFAIAGCEVRWAYILAIIGIFDAFILATLAFVLAKRQAKSLPDWTQGHHNGTVTKSDLNGYMTEVESKPGSVLQPVLMVPSDVILDHQSEYSMRSAHQRDFAL